VDAEGLLDEEALAGVVTAFELDLKGFAEDAQGVVTGVEGAVDDGRDHAFGIVVEQPSWTQPSLYIRRSAR
jgi:hypothetical protein